MSVRRFSGALLVALILESFVVVASLHAATTVVTVDPSLSARGIGSVGTLRRLATGGFTPAYKAGRAILSNLRASGMRRMRLINISWGTKVTRSPDGTLNIHWSPKLEHELAICRQFGFIPHIVIGQTAPGVLALRNGSGKVYGVRSWPLYQSYIKALVRHVVDRWGFQTSEWEVGNEMNNPRWDWLRANRDRPQLDERGYRDYLQLYSHISAVFRVEKQAYPGKVILLGGPALTDNSLHYPPGNPKNWLLRFIRDVAARQLVCDFISLHVYGAGFSGQDLATRLGWLKDAIKETGRDMPVWITEWGTNPFFRVGKINFTPAAGAFSLAFVDQLAQSGVGGAIFLAARRKSGGYGPALFNANGTPADAYKSLHYLMSLSGRRVNCTTGTASVGCIATRDTDGLTVLLWYLDWHTHKIGGRDLGSWFPKLAVEVKVPSAGGATYDVSRVDINGTNVTKNSPASPHEVGSENLLGPWVLRYGDYARLRLIAH